MTIQTEIPRKMLGPDQIVPLAFCSRNLSPTMERIIGERMAEAAKRDRRMHPQLIMWTEAEECRIEKSRRQSADASRVAALTSDEIFAQYRDRLGAEFTIVDFSEMSGRARQSASALVVGWHRRGLVAKVRLQRKNRNYVQVWGTL